MSDRFTIEPNGGVFALYEDGLRLCNISEPDPGVLAMIAKALNDAARQSDPPQAVDDGGGFGLDTPQLPEGAVWADEFIEADSYGVHGSDFSRCRVCGGESGAGMLNKGIEHDADCALQRALKRAEEYRELFDEDDCQPAAPPASPAQAEKDFATHGLSIERISPQEFREPSAETSGEALKWAVDKWFEEVSERPLVNMYRRVLDDTWRQVIRHMGGDDVSLCGPRHDDLYVAAGKPPLDLSIMAVAPAQESEGPSISDRGSQLQYEVMQQAMADAERFRWLTYDHASTTAREHCRNILKYMGTRSHSASSRDIDLAIQKFGWDDGVPKP